MAKASGVALDDALAITLFVGGRIGRTVDDLIRLSTSLPPMLETSGRNAASAIRAAATDATGKVVESAVAQVEARHAEMSATVGAQIADVAREVMREQIAAGRIRRAGLFATAVCGSTSSPSRSGIRSASVSRPRWRTIWPPTPLVRTPPPGCA